MRWRSRMTMPRLLIVFFIMVVSAAPRPVGVSVRSMAAGGCERGDAAGCASAVQHLSTPSPYDIVSIWGGARESIALGADGTVWTWGLNNCDPTNFAIGPCGKLGDATSTERREPVQVHR